MPNTLLAFILSGALALTSAAAWPAQQSTRIAAFGTVAPLAPLNPTPTPTVAPTPDPTPAPTLKPTPETTPEPCRASGTTEADYRRRLRCAWPGDDGWAERTVNCEMGGVWDGRDSRSGRYHGFWQFDLPTWRGNGGNGDPHLHSIEEQTRVAWNTYQRRGAQPWACG